MCEKHITNTAHKIAKILQNYPENYLTETSQKLIKLNIIAIFEKIEDTTNPLISCIHKVIIKKNNLTKNTCDNSKNGKV
jgi:hypothetical protein